MVRGNEKGMLHKVKVTADGQRSGKKSNHRLREAKLGIQAKVVTHTKKVHLSIRFPLVIRE